MCVHVNLFIQFHRNRRGERIESEETELLKTRFERLLRFYRTHPLTAAIHQFILFLTDGEISCSVRWYLVALMFSFLLPGKESKAPFSTRKDIRPRIDDGRRGTRKKKNVLCFAPCCRRKSPWNDFISRSLIVREIFSGNDCNCFYFHCSLFVLNTECIFSFMFAFDRCWLVEENAPSRRERFSSNIFHEFSWNWAPDIIAGLYRDVKRRYAVEKPNMCIL